MKALKHEKDAEIQHLKEENEQLNIRLNEQDNKINQLIERLNQLE